MSLRDRLTDPASMRFKPDPAEARLLGLCPCCGKPLLALGSSVRHPTLGRGVVSGAFTQDHWNVPVKFSRNECSIVPRNSIKEL
jgi:hypothetical protein